MWVCCPPPPSVSKIIGGPGPPLPTPMLIERIMIANYSNCFSLSRFLRNIYPLFFLLGKYGTPSRILLVAIWFIDSIQDWGSLDPGKYYVSVMLLLLVYCIFLNAEHVNYTNKIFICFLSPCKSQRITVIKFKDRITYKLKKVRRTISQGINESANFRFLHLPPLRLSMISCSLPRLPSTKNGFLQKLSM